MKNKLVYFAFAILTLISLACFTQFSAKFKDMPFSETSLFAYEENQSISKVRVIYDKARIYSTQDITNLDDQQLNTVTIAIVNLHQVLNVIGQQNDFFEVEVGLLNGFIKKTMVIDDSLSSPNKVLDTNGKTTSTCALYIKENKNYILQEKTIEPDTKIKILDGYDKEKEYTQIAFQENEIIQTYYVKTSQIKVEGVNVIFYVAGGIIIAGVSICLFLIKVCKPKPIIKKDKV